MSKFKESKDFSKFGTLTQNITAEIYDLFAPVEGLNTVYYGKVRNGKTYAATADILELLKRGEIVYANWQITFEDFDERTSFWIALYKLVFRKKYFFQYSKENFHYFHPDQIDIDFLGKLVGVHIFIDEGQWIFNSHVREKAEDPEAIAKRRLILHGGHYCRSLNVVTQRPVNLIKDIRSQINVWYKCVKRFQLGPILLFQRWEYQDMKDDIPDEELPVGKPKTYFANKDVFNAYNTHGMRDENAIVNPPVLGVVQTTFLDRLNLVLSHLLPRFAQLRKRGRGADHFGKNRLSKDTTVSKKHISNFLPIVKKSRDGDVT